MTTTEPVATNPALRRVLFYSNVARVVVTAFFVGWYLDPEPTTRTAVWFFLAVGLCVWSVRDLARLFRRTQEAR